MRDTLVLSLFWLACEILVFFRVGYEFNFGTFWRCLNIFFWWMLTYIVPFLEDIGILGIYAIVDRRLIVFSQQSGTIE